MCLVQIYTAVLRNADENIIAEFVQMYKQCYTPEEKERIILLLAEVNQEDLIAIILKFSITVYKPKQTTLIK